jgi:hypothetical protein
MSAALSLQPHRQPEVRINRSAEQRGRREGVPKQATCPAPQASADTTRSAIVRTSRLSSTKVGQHDRATTARWTLHQHLVHEVVHPRPRIPEPATRPWATLLHSSILPEPRQQPAKAPGSQQFSTGERTTAWCMRGRHVPGCTPSHASEVNVNCLHFALAWRRRLLDYFATARPERTS